MRTIKIQFADFFPDWNAANNFIIRALKKHYQVEFSDQPDYLFFSCFGDEHLKYDCVKIFWTGEDLTPDFNLCDYAIAFDSMSFGDRYLRYPLFAIGGRVENALRNHVFSEADVADERGFCSFVVSNGNANPLREAFFHQLSEYKTVASGGRFLNNVGGPVEDKLAFLGDYRFNIAFENDMSEGYTSEKIMDAFAAKTVPIYWGNKKIAEDFNPDCFINCHDFQDFASVIEYVKKVDSDPVLYNRILTAPLFKEKSAPFAFTPAALEEFLCRIIDQPMETAKRISRFSRKSDYLNTQKEKAELYRLAHHNNLCKVLRRIVK
ncbi:MAG: glycosyltransferase [Clostridia bacterium]|nr:glycosyltransferase [Clostridia bacterium]